MIDDSSRCPCLSGETYGACCGPLHRGAAAPTAERLMRSRFSAFAVGDADYLMASWHPDTRPDQMELDDGIRWYRLDIERTERGGLLDDDGIVEFTAFWKGGGESGMQHEVSSFSRVDGRWVYVDAAA